MQPRTDLAMEAKALYERSAQEQTKLSGVIAREQERHGVRMTVVKITSAEGEQALGKPRGTYITAELEALTRREPGSFSDAARTAGPSAARTAGAVQAGARRRARQPGHHAGCHRPGGREEPDRHAPSAGRAWVRRCRASRASQPASRAYWAQTGIESLELVKCAMQTAQPDVVIVIDALAAAEPGRLFRTVQLSDSGIVPGSGVGNSRQRVFPADAGRPGRGRGRADGRGCVQSVPAGGTGT